MKRIDWRAATVGTLVGVFGGFAVSETLEERVEKLEAEVEDLTGHVFLIAGLACDRHQDVYLNGYAHCARWLAPGVREAETKADSLRGEK